MELVEVIKKRHSVRKYHDKQVPDELLFRIIELARSAPSAGNLKAYEAIITKEKVTEQVDAPIYIVICADLERAVRRYGDRGRNLYSIQDATIFGSYIQLIAVDIGLSTVWIGAFREDRVRRILSIREGLRPVAIIAIGYESKNMI